MAFLLLLTFLLVNAPAALTSHQAPGAASADAGQKDAALLPKVRLIATGGTISNRTGGRLTSDELLKSMPGHEAGPTHSLSHSQGSALKQLCAAFARFSWLQLSLRVSSAAFLTPLAFPVTQSCP